MQPLARDPWMLLSLVGDPHVPAGPGGAAGNAANPVASYGDQPGPRTSDLTNKSGIDQFDTSAADWSDPSHLPPRPLR